MACCSSTSTTIDPTLIGLTILVVGMVGMISFGLHEKDRVQSIMDDACNEAGYDFFELDRCFNSSAGTYVGVNMICDSHWVIHKCEVQK